jgi:hypothetical protein
MGKDLVDHHRIFNARNDLHGSTNAAGGRMPGAAHGRSVFGRILRANLVALVRQTRVYSIAWRRFAQAPETQGCSVSVPKNIQREFGCP